MTTTKRQGKLVHLQWCPRDGSTLAVPNTGLIYCNVNRVAPTFSLQEEKRNSSVILVPVGQSRGNATTGGRTGTDLALGRHVPEEVSMKLEAKDRVHLESHVVEKETVFIRQIAAGNDLQPVIGDFECRPRRTRDILDFKLCDHIICGSLDSSLLKVHAATCRLT